MDPRLRVLYLAIVAVGALVLADFRVLIGLAVAHVVAWVALGEGTRALGRQLFKLTGFAAFIVLSYALTKDDPSTDRWTKLYGIDVNAGGALVGARMVLRVVIVVLASRIARAGDPRAIAEGLRRIGVPEVVSLSMDAVLSLMGGSGSGGGRGGGGGRGRGGGRDGAKGSFWASLKRIAGGDVGPIAERIERQVDRVQSHLGDKGTADIAIIAALSLTMLGIKALKVLPSIPFAPGHKLVLLTPLYIVAALRTKTRAGATLTGLVMGSVAFLLGDGRYGVFEILKHVAPGVLCDLFVPLFRRRAGGLAWSVLGGVMGLGRFATIFTITLVAQPPAIAWAILVPGLIVHTTFGVLSGLVSAPLVKRATPQKEEHEQAGDRRRPDAHRIASDA
jgi:hypothetical protein